jgi:hypothetical protein
MKRRVRVRDEGERRIVLPDARFPRRLGRAVMRAIVAGLVPAAEAVEFLRREGRAVVRGSHRVQFE